MAGKMAKAAAQKDILDAAGRAEKQLDATLHQLDEITGDDLEAIRRRRLKELKDRRANEEVWSKKGHGMLQELQNEKDWFEAAKSSPRVVTHFFRTSTRLCEVMDKHLTKIAAHHVETRFIKLEAERAPFLAQRLDIEALPTLIMTKDSQTHGKLIGFEGLPGLDQCTTEDLERFFAIGQMINYEGDMRMTGPSIKPKSTIASKSTSVRTSTLNKNSAIDADSDEDW